MEIAVAAIAVVGTVLGAGVVGVQQYLVVRAMAALAELSIALADHRRAMWVREDLRLSGAAAEKVAEAREASHVTRSALTAPQVALTMLLPTLRLDIEAAVRAVSAMRGARSSEALASYRETAVSAADALTATAAGVLSRP